MLRAKIEIIPFGREDEARELSRFDIFNKGHIDFGHCKYGVIEINENGAGLWDDEIFHRRDLGPEELVRKVLEHRKKLSTTHD